ncbi:MAG: sortase [Candidatus Dormibacter sp.]
MRLRTSINWAAAALIASGAVLTTTAMVSHPPSHGPGAIQVLPGTRGSNLRPGPSSPLPPRFPQTSGGSQGPGIIATLSIPRIAIDSAPVRDRGTDGKGGMAIASGYGITHFTGSSAIGQGNAVLYGHDDIDGSVFARLGELQPGDGIVVRTSTGDHQYQVATRRIVAPTAVQILKPTSGVQLTLFTCWPTNIDSQRLVITAVPATVLAQ